MNKAKPITDLGVPAFNAGSKFVQSGDWGNGLAVLIDTVAHVLVFVDDYRYDSCKEEYTINLVFEIYDVFGLDDDDVRDFGASSKVWNPDARIGITAWWQLQHQFDYAPMITRAVVKRQFTVPAGNEF